MLYFLWGEKRKEKEKKNSPWQTVASQKACVTPGNKESDDAYNNTVETHVNNISKFNIN
jgi:hypothetical protein